MYIRGTVFVCSFNHKGLGFAVRRLTNMYFGNCITPLPFHLKSVKGFIHEMGFEPTNSKRRDLKSRAFDHFATRVLNFVFYLMLVPFV